MFPQDQLLNQIRRRRVQPPYDEFEPQPRPEAVMDVQRPRILDLLKGTPGFAGGTLQGQIDRSGAQTQPYQQEVAEPPQGIQLSTGQETRPSIVGGSLETDPLKREAARIRTMIENPTRDVSTTGAASVSKPMGRWKAAGLGALFGLAQGGPDTPLAARLAAGATGAGIGAGKPSLVQDWRRRMEVQDAQGQLAQQQKIGLGQATLESEKAEARQRQMAPEIALIEAERKARYDADRIKVQQDAAEGRISIAEATNKLRQMEFEERQRHNLETERQAREKPVSDAQAAQAAEGESIAESTEQASNELKGTLDQQKGQLMENERALSQKDAYWNSQAAKIVAESGGEIKLPEALAQVRANDPDYVNGTYNTTVNNTEALRKAVADGDKRMAEMAQQVRQGRAKGARGGRSSSSSGRKWSASRWAAANPSGDVAAAKAAAKAAGYQVVD